MVEKPRGSKGAQEGGAAGWDGAWPPQADRGRSPERWAVGVRCALVVPRHVQQVGAQPGQSRRADVRVSTDPVQLAAWGVLPRLLPTPPGGPQTHGSECEETKALWVAVPPSGLLGCL